MVSDAWPAPVQAELPLAVLPLPLPLLVLTCVVTWRTWVSPLVSGPEAWKVEVTKMREAYGAPIDDDTANTIMKYLSTTYGVQPKS